MKREVHILPAEGGEDAQLFAKDLCKAYVRLADRMGWKVG